MNEPTNKSNAQPRPIIYWRLWLLDTVLVSAGFWFFLATNYGTYEFFGKALLMALLPLIPVMVLVGGGGSTVFALTKVWIEKRSVSRLTGVALLVGPGLAITLALVILGIIKSPASRLSYICAGNPPVAVSGVQVAGYSSFLREELLAVFQVAPEHFQKFVAGAKLEPVPSLEFSKMLEQSSLKTTKPFQNLPTAGELKCFKRVFKESTEHERGSVYAAFDPVATIAVVFREYHD